MSNNCETCAVCLENCDDTFACIDQYITNVINNTIENNYFCAAAVKCVNDNIDDIDFCPIVYECLRSLPGYTDTGTIFLTLVDDTMQWIDLSSVGSDIVIESGNCINVSGTGSSLDPIIFDLDESCFRALFSAGDCLNYNVLTGEFSLDEDCIQDLVGLTFIDTTTVNFTYNDLAGTVEADVNISADLNNGIEVRADGLFVNSDPRPGELVYGGVVTWLQDYDFYVSPAGYFINGVFYESPEAFITLNPADPSLDRFDVIYVDADEIVKVLEGDPSLTPAQPGLDLGLQLGLGVIFVEAGSSSPVDLVTECLYEENAEWTAVGSDIDIDVASNNSPCVGLVGIEATSADNGDYILLDRGTSEAISSLYNIITFRLKPKGDWSNDVNINHRLKFQFQLAGTPVGSAVFLADTAFNFSSTNLTCQIISIPIIQFGISSTTQVDQLKITVVSELNPPTYPFGFYLDGLCMQGGIFGATESDDIHNQYFGPQTPGRYWISGNARIEGWITSPDMVSNGVNAGGSEKFGWGSIAIGTASTAIGFLAKADGQEGSTAVGNQSRAEVGVAVGFGAYAIRSVAVGGTSTGSGGVAVGPGAVNSSLSGISIGGNATASNGPSNIALGYGALADSPYGAIALGNGAQATAQFSLALGTATIADITRDFVVGGTDEFSDYGYQNFYFGSGKVSEFSADRFFTITGASGSNVAGNNWTFAGAKGTGNSSTGSKIVFQTSDAGASGTTLQSLSNKLEILKTGGLIFNKYGINTFAGVPAYTLGVDASGNVVEFTPGFGSGSVTSFSSGNLSPLFTTSVSNATTTPALSFSLSNAAGGTVFGNSSSSSGAPLYTSNPVLGRTGVTGTIGLSGTVGGTITIRPQANAGTYNFNLPTTAGTSGWVLASQGGGASPMVWVDPDTLGGGGGGGISASNGITENVADNVEWGGALIHDTTIDGNDIHSVLFDDLVDFTKNGVNTFITDTVAISLYSDGGSEFAWLNLDTTAPNFKYRIEAQGASLYTGIYHHDGGGALQILSSNIIQLNPDVATIAVNRFCMSEGAQLPAANDLTLGLAGNSFSLTGNTQINAITVDNWNPGSIIILKFLDTPTLKHNTAGGVGTATMLLSGGVDYVAGPGDAIMFEYDGGNWFEISRKLAATAPFTGITADNGLTENVANNVQLFGPVGSPATLLDDRFLDQGAFDLNMTSTSSSYMMRLTNSVARGINLSTIETGIFAQSNDFTDTIFAVNDLGAGVHGYGVTNGVYATGNGTASVALHATNRVTVGDGGGTGGSLAIRARFYGDTHNTAIPIIEIDRRTTGIGGFPSTAAAGLGASIRFKLQTATDSSVQFSNDIVSKWVTATTATRTSQLDIIGANSAASNTIASFYGSGVVGIGISSSYTATRLNVVDNTVGAGSIVDITSTSTAAASNSQKGLSVSLSGTNVTTDQTTVGVYGSNTHAGTNSSNYGGYFTSSNGTTTNIGVGGFTTTGYGVYGAASSAGGYGVYGVINSTGGAGVYGQANSGYGVYASASTGGISGVFLQSSSNTNSVIENLRLSRNTSGTAASGIGGSLTYYIQNASSTSVLAASIETYLTTATAASETSKMDIKMISGGSSVTSFTIGSDASIKLRPITATAASAITPEEGMIVIVSDTNGTFTSIGFWGYSNGAWAKF